ncbi:MAG: hypothetical protein GX621_09600 [Pirellulaceae bacterium]|nr:hypothetical protein [Pirellulaceae bacterium]
MELFGSKTARCRRRETTYDDAASGMRRAAKNATRRNTELFSNHLETREASKQRAESARDGLSVSVLGEGLFVLYAGSLTAGDADPISDITEHCASFAHGMNIK